MSDSKQVRPAVLLIHNITARLLSVRNTISGFSRLYAVKSREQALGALENVEDIRLIMLDLESPYLSSYEFLDFLQDSPQFGQIPVIAVTLKPQEAIDKRLKDYANVQGVLGKPSTMEEIREMTAEILKVSAHTRGGDGNA